MKKYLIELQFNNNLTLKLNYYLNLKINLKINLLNKKLKLLNFNFLKITLLKKNYYNLLNSNEFFEDFLFNKSKLNFPKNLKKKLKTSLKSFCFSNKYSFLFLFFLLQKNKNKKKLIFKKRNRNKLSSLLKKKPKIYLNYIKLFKNINSYDHFFLQKNYDFDWNINLVFQLNLKFNQNNLNFSNNFVNLICFNFYKFLKI